MELFKKAFEALTNSTMEDSFAYVVDQYFKSYTSILPIKPMLEGSLSLLEDVLTVYCQIGFKASVAIGGNIFNGVPTEIEIGTEKKIYRMFELSGKFAVCQFMSAVGISDDKEPTFGGH